MNIRAIVLGALKDKPKTSSSVDEPDELAEALSLFKDASNDRERAVAFKAALEAAKK